MSGPEDRFDQLLLSIAQQHRGIDELLETMFGFLRRRTDFFTGPGGLEGAKGSVMTALERQTDKIRVEIEKREAAKAKEAKRAEERRKKAAAIAAKAAKEEAEAAAAKVAALRPEGAGAAAAAPGVVELGADGGFDLDAAEAASGDAPVAPAPAAAAAAAAPAPAAAAAAADAGASGGAGGDGKTKKAGAEGDDAGAGADADADAEAEAEEDDDGPKLEGNGGTTDKYKWTQTLSEVNVQFGVPAYVKGKHVVCDITPTRIKVGVKGEAPLVEAPFPKRVKSDDCYWTLETNDDGSRALVVYLTKENQMEWWNCIAEGEPKINTRRVEPENSKLSDLDAETRQTVEKMMFDQRAKAMGMPTSDERAKQEVLQKFMKAHPEMDFSKAKIN